MDDVVVRRERDDRVTATVTRSFADVIAPGAVRLNTTDLQGAARSPHLRFARARAYQVLAIKFAANPEVSFDLAKLGIDELGDQYVRWDVMDDSGIHLKVSLGQRNDPEKLPFAAERMRSVLRSRLRNYAVRWQADVL